MEKIGDQVTVRMAGTTPKEIDAIYRYIYLLGEYQKMSAQAVCISKETLKEQMENKTLEVALAEYKGEPIGLGLFYTLASGFSGKTSMFLNIFYVEEKVRFLGAGRKIISFLSQICLDRNYERMEWLCLDWNEPSIKFYKSVDSRIIDTITTYRLMPEDMEKLAAEK